MIKIDRGYISEISNKLLDSAIKTVEKYLSSPKHQIVTVTGDRMLGSRGPVHEIELEDVVGNIKSAKIYWVFMPKVSPQYVHGAEVIEVLGNYRINVFFNSYKTLKDLRDNGYKQTMSALAHEITHLRDKLDFKDPVPDRYEVASDATQSEYYNSDAEVKAFMRTFYEETIDDILVDIFSGAKISDAIIDQLEKNRTWLNASKYYTQQNKRKIYSALSKEVINTLSGFEDGI
jgi:hypothetical protein